MTTLINTCGSKYINRTAPGGGKLEKLIEAFQLFSMTLCKQKCVRTIKEKNMRANVRFVCVCVCVCGVHDNESVCGN